MNTDSPQNNDDTLYQRFFPQIIAPGYAPENFTAS